MSRLPSFLVKSYERQTILVDTFVRKVRGARLMVALHLNDPTFSQQNTLRALIKSKDPAAGTTPLPPTACHGQCHQSRAYRDAACVAVAVAASDSSFVVLCGALLCRCMRVCARVTVWRCGVRLRTSQTIVTCVTA